MPYLRHRLREHAARAGLAVATLCVVSCSLTEGALDGVGADGGLAPDASIDVPIVLDTATPDGPAFEARPLVSLEGAPGLVGCADGTREGFLATSAGAWPRIAGCSGAWDQPGLTPQAVMAPLCERSSGNTGRNQAGVGCGAADLCASGWHVCQGPGEVDRLSPSQCESVVAPGVAAFFAVAGGGGVGGECAAGQLWLNDLRGCGSMGHPESDGCFPLDRRMEFTDCLATAGVWNCGTVQTPFEEVKAVVKLRNELGGVLCCRDEQ